MTSATVVSDPALILQEWSVKKISAATETEFCRDQDSNLGYYGHNVGS
jgi:hypothetical protein